VGGKMKKILFTVTLVSAFNLFAVDICVMTTQVGDPFSTAKQDCTHIQGGAGNVATKLTSDQLLFLYNSGFSIVTVASIAGSSTGTAMVYTLKRD
jgi:hypothetical protein